MDYNNGHSRDVCSKTAPCSPYLDLKFKVGDLVLVFTLKEFFAKFTIHCRGPYVIANLSSNGDVKLSTLDTKEMPN